METNEVSIATRFGKVVQRRRKQLGMSQEVLAEKASLHRTYVSLIELGKRTVTIAVAGRLARAFDTTMSELMREADEIEPKA